LIKISKNEKTVHLEPEVHEGIRVLAFKKRTKIKKEIDRILRKELDIPIKEV